MAWWPVYIRIPLQQPKDALPKKTYTNHKSTVVSFLLLRSVHNTLGGVLDMGQCAQNAPQSAENPGPEAGHTKPSWKKMKMSHPPTLSLPPPTPRSHPPLS